MSHCDCPTDHQLRAYDQGDLSRDELDTISAHLRSCRGCLDRLVSLASGTGAFPSGPAEAPADAEYRRAVALLAARLPAASPLPGVGDTLRDYRLMEKVGRGGMGMVFKAVHVKLDRVVAVKVLSGRRWQDPAAVARFEREMKAVGRLDHPNIVHATDAGDSDGVPFLVMEFVDGENLAALVRRRGPLPLAEACGLVRQAAAGLHHAHQAGIIHRDVKPSNLMLDRDGVLKVLDLGLALSLASPPSDDTGVGSGTGSLSASGGGSDLTSPDHTVGTLDYMPPEQRQDAHAVDARADVYGLGCTFWYLLTGRPPMPGDATDSRALPGRLAAEFWRRFLASDPADRFPTVADAVDALDRAVALPARRHRGRRVVAVACLIAAVVALAYVARRDRPPPAAGFPPTPAIGQLPLADEEAVTLRQSWADHRGVPVHRDGPDGQTFALIPPGGFMLSSQCRVRITRPYYLATREVTVAQFRRFIAATKYVPSAISTGQGGFVLKPDFMTGGREIKSHPSLNWERPGHAKLDPDQAVCVVSWDDATAYCKWLTEQDGRGYRLPTEAELAWAVRCGDPSDEMMAPALGLQLGWHFYNSNNQPHAVGRLKANAWGLYDTHGNVAEWCVDRAGPLPAGTFDDYAGPTDPARTRRVFLGYSYLAPVFKPSPLRSNALPDQSFAHVGFRVACDVP
jgi:serine/threonine protein kinase/formylglycine-generating enzyme required for sulfatase activity